MHPWELTKNQKITLFFRIPFSTRRSAYSKGVTEEGESRKKKGEKSFSRYEQVHFEKKEDYSLRIRPNCIKRRVKGRQGKSVPRKKTALRGKKNRKERFVKDGEEKNSD